ncbi:MBL fold metallo-hydrolase [Bacillus massilinigeriensis]|uniref:MBL fold metallo-hydrolase n=1 Tax=Bacillus massilionigeriensis TaxID=1805475 RepID=UPI00096B32AC|nr:MBL fold metallo-hydrolase [Bacillus massilionigeriensis]
MEKKLKMKIIRVPIPTPTLWPNTTTNCYLIGNERECIMVDAGFDQPVTKELLEVAIQLHQLAIPKSIVLTHYHLDHAPGIRQLMDWSPTVFCHKNERQAVLDSIHPWDDLLCLEDGDFLSIAGEVIKVIHAPGHTTGHLNLYIPSEKTLISGDNLVAEGTSWIGPPDGDMSDYLQTLTSLKQLNLEKIAPGHGDWIHSPYEHIDFVLNRRLQRESQILSLLQEFNQLTSLELTELIYQNHIHPSVFDVAKRTIEAHLIKSIKDGHIIKHGTFYSILLKRFN